jgi:hypothetical protein
MDKLNTELRQQAVDFGLCDKWRGDWKSDKNQQELIDMWKKGIDFAIIHDYPSIDFIKANFDRKLLNRNLIFVDEPIEIKNAPSGIYVINGECSGTLWFNSWAAATVYVRHNSNVRIIADDFAKVFVRLYDDASADVIELDGAVIKVYDRRE